MSQSVTHNVAEFKGNSKTTKSTQNFLVNKLIQGILKVSQLETIIRFCLPFMTIHRVEDSKSPQPVFLFLIDLSSRFSYTLLLVSQPIMDSSRVNKKKRKRVHLINVTESHAEV